MRIIALALLFGACTHTRVITYEDGGQAFITKCDATKFRCLEEAGATCPRGYQVLGENKMDTSNGSISAGGGVAMGKVSSKTLMSLVFRCRTEEPVSH